MSRCIVVEPGLVPYGEAWSWQQALVRLRQQQQCGDVLLLLEHPPTFTLGRKTDRGNFLVPMATLAERGYEVVAIDRGGDVTFHGPGQIVGYPILQLAEAERDYPGYIRRLEAVLIGALAEFGFVTERLPGFSGVWWQGRKLAAIGVKIAHGVTSHGFALNVTTDLRHFQHIVPCGIADKPVSSLAEVAAELQLPVPAMAELCTALCRHFSRVFARDCERLGPRASRQFVSNLPLPTVVD